MVFVTQLDKEIIDILVHRKMVVFLTLHYRENGCEQWHSQDLMEGGAKVGNF